MLSCIPTSHETLRATNDYGAALVSAHPDRFGLLAALPTDDPTACLVEIERTVSSYAIPPDGFALSTCYNNQPLADPRLDPVWAALDVREPSFTSIPQPPLHPPVWVFSRLP